MFVAVVRGEKTIGASVIKGKKDCFGQDLEKKCQLELCSLLGCQKVDLSVRVQKCEGRIGYGLKGSERVGMWDLRWCK